MHFLASGGIPNSDRMVIRRGHHAHFVLAELGTSDRARMALQLGDQLPRLGVPNAGLHGAVLLIRPSLAGAGEQVLSLRDVSDMLQAIPSRESALAASRRERLNFLIPSGYFGIHHSGSLRHKRAEAAITPMQFVAAFA